jgi:hypothetical protein
MDSILKCKVSCITICYHYRHHEGKALIGPFQRRLSIYLYSGSVNPQVATNLSSSLPIQPCYVPNPVSSAAQNFYKHAFIQSVTKSSPIANCIKTERVSEFSETALVVMITESTTVEERLFAVEAKICHTKRLFSNHPMYTFSTAAWI